MDVVEVVAVVSMIVRIMICENSGEVDVDIDVVVDGDDDVDLDVDADGNICR